MLMFTSLLKFSMVSEPVFSTTSMELLDGAQTSYPGDAIFIRTGRWARRADVGPWPVAALAAGLHASAMPWIKARDVSFLGSDAGADVAPSQIDGVALPVHILSIVAMGVDLFDNQDLEALAETGLHPRSSPPGPREYPQDHPS